MTDARLKQTYSLEGVTMDLLLRDNGLLDEREELATAIRVALGTDALADEGEILPDPDSTDRRGWWGDLEAQSIWNGWGIGCKNWLLTRAKITDGDSFEGSTLARAENYTRSALQWFIDNRIATRIDVSAVQTELERIEVSVTIYRGPLVEIDLRYQLLWQEEPFIEIADGGLPTKPTIKLIRIPYMNCVLSTTAPVVTRTFDHISPDAAQLTLSSTEPGRNFNANIVPSQGNLALSSVEPTARATDIFIEPPQGNRVLSSTAPTVTCTTGVIGIMPPRRDLVLSPNFVTVTRGSIYPVWTASTSYGPVEGMNHCSYPYGITSWRYISPNTGTAPAPTDPNGQYFWAQM